MAIRKKLLIGGTLGTTLVAAFALATSQPPSTQDVADATNALVARAQTGCTVSQDATLLREVFSGVSAETVTRLDRRNMTICLHPQMEPMTKLPSLSISYYGHGNNTFTLSTQISPEIREPLLRRVADAGYTSPIEFVDGFIDSMGSPRPRNTSYEEEVAAQSAGMRNASDEAIILQQILTPKR